MAARLAGLVAGAIFLAKKKFLLVECQRMSSKFRSFFAIFRLGWDLDMITNLFRGCLSARELGD